MPDKKLENMSRFVGTADEFYSPICNTCRHFHLGTPTCEAFSDRIPNAIFEGDFDHHKAHPNDGGIQYEKGDGLKTW